MRIVRAAVTGGVVRLVQPPRFCCYAVLALCLAACGRKEASVGTPVAIARAAPGTVSLPPTSRAFLAIEPVDESGPKGARTYFGRTAFRPKALSAITAPFSGRVASVGVEPGQRVRAHAPLFTIESADALGMRSSLDQARIRVRTAEDVLARQNEMVKRGVGLEIERFDAEMKLREARAELARSERGAALLGAGQGSLVTVRAPVDGVVVSVKAAPGATVQAGGEPLVEIGDPRGLWIVADVPEGEAGSLRKATSVEVAISALNVVLQGRITGTGPRSDPETRRTPIYVELEKTPVDLNAGLLVRVSVPPPAATGEIWLPVTAVLLKEGGKRVVYLETGDGKLVAREIQVGDERGGRVRVLQGLKLGERVVMRGALLVDREAEQLL